MSKTTRAVALAVVAVIAGLTGACTHYQITDPTTGRSYFTKDAGRAPSSGAVVFTDAKTGEVLTLQNTQMKQISREEFGRAVGK